MKAGTQKKKELVRLFCECFLPFGRTLYVAMEPRLAFSTRTRAAQRAGHCLGAD
jgi:hypothetical protein